METKRQPSEDEIRGALEAILHSRTFGAQSSLLLLLSYLVNRTLSDPQTPLKEYTIGVEVFGKPESYDPQQDAYVRAQASRLRQKLLEYYATEGMADPVRIELPRRQFLLQFHKQPAPPAGAAPGRGPNYWKISAIFLFFALLATLAVVGRRSVSKAGAKEPSSEMRAIWGNFLRSPRPVVLCLGTHQFYSYQGGFIREPALDRAPPEAVQHRLDELALLLKKGPLRPNHGYTGTGQATAAFLLGKFFGDLGVHADLIRSSSLTWDSISGHNVIFLGSAKSNPQIHSLPADWAFRIEGESIVNRQPLPGEPESWNVIREREGRERTEFALLSFLAGLHRVGEILVIESSTTTGIWAGAKFLTEEIYARELVRKLSKGANPVPNHYQAVLRVSVRDGVPLKIVYEAHRPI